MSHEKLTYEDLLQIIELVKSSEQWSEFHLKVGDLEVDFKRAPRSSSVASSAAATDSQAATSAAAWSRIQAAAWSHPLHNGPTKKYREPTYPRPATKVAPSRWRTKRSTTPWS